MFKFFKKKEKAVEPCKNIVVNYPMYPYKNFGNTKDKSDKIDVDTYNLSLSDVSRQASGVMTNYLNDMRDSHPSVNNPLDNVTIRFITIDEEYRMWLIKSHISDSLKNFTGYMMSVNDSDAERLLKKNHLDISFDLLYFPVILEHKTIIKEEQNCLFVYSEKKCEEITGYLEKIFGCGNVNFPGNIMTLEEVKNNSARVLSSAKTKILNNDTSVYCDNKIKSVHSSEVCGHSRTVLFVPYIVRHENGVPVYNSSLFDDYKRLIKAMSFNDIVLKSAGFDYKEISFKKISDAICSFVCIDNDCFSTNSYKKKYIGNYIHFPYFAEDINDFLEDDKKYLSHLYKIKKNERETK